MGGYGSKLIKSWLQDNNVDKYSTHNEDKSAVAERLIRTLKNKIFKYIISIAKKLHIKKLYDIVDEYINACHRTIKVKFAYAK